MPMLRTCSSPGCDTLTLGERCLEHEAADTETLAPEPLVAAAAALPHDPAAETGDG